MWKPIIALKADRVFRSQLCSGELDLLKLMASNNTGGTSGKSYRLGIFLDVPIAGTIVNFQYIDATQSVASYSTISASAATAITGVAPIFSITAGGNSTIQSDLGALDFVFGPGRIVVIAINSDDAIDGSFSLNWYEQQ